MGWPHLREDALRQGGHVQLEEGDPVLLKNHEELPGELVRPGGHSDSAQKTFDPARCGGCQEVTPLGHRSPQKAAIIGDFKARIRLRCVLCPDLAGDDLR